MQRQREARENSRTDGRQFNNFGSFGFQGSMFPSVFGETDPFDDPFFSRPLGSSLFGSDKSSSGKVQNPKEPVIEELDSDDDDDDGATEHEENAVGSAAWTNRNPLVEHLEDQGNGNRILLGFSNFNFCTGE